MEETIKSKLDRLYLNTHYDVSNYDYEKVVEYIEKLERENFGLRQQVTNLREKDEKRWL